MSEKVRFGLCNCAYALLTEADDGTPTWAAPVLMPNATSISFARTKSSQDVYADNKLLYSSSTITGAKITLNMTVITDAVKQALLGHKADKNGADVEVVNAKPSYFALIYQVEGDTQSRRRLVFKCTASMADESSDTQSDSPKVNTDSLEISVYPISNGDKVITHKDVDSDDSEYATMLTTAPVLPTYTVS
jgi:phi13 family phage major tail protein